MATASQSAPPTRLRTERLTLREMVAADLDFIARMLGDHRVMRHYPSVLDREGARAWIANQRARYERDGHGLWLAALASDGTPVGQVGLLAQRIEGRPAVEVAYLLDRPCWGRGLATEAAAGARDHAFADLGCTQVFSLVRPVNAASRAVAERLGMHRAGRTRHRGLVHDVFTIEAGSHGGSRRCR